MIWRKCVKHDFELAVVFAIEFIKSSGKLDVRRSICRSLTNARMISMLTCVARLLFKTFDNIRILTS